jgi:hypothetical protein
VVVVLSLLLIFKETVESADTDDDVALEVKVAVGLPGRGRL